MHLVELFDLKEVHYRDYYPDAFEVFRKKYRRLARQHRIHDLYVQFSNYANDAMDRTAYQKPDHADPVGVYGYPMAYVLSHPADIWYGKSARFLRVLRATPKSLLHITSLTENDAENLLYKMGFRYGRDLMFRARKYLKSRVGRSIPKAFLAVVQLDLSVVPEKRTGLFGTSHDFPVRSGAQQTALFRKAGIDAIVDTARRNTSAVINDREPEQIIFLTRSAFRIVEVVNLRARTDTSNLVFSDPKHLARKLVAAIAGVLDDRLSENDNLIFWTKKGRRIAVDFQRPPSYYRDRRMGEKKHRNDKLSDDFRTEIEIETEIGSIHERFTGDTTFREIIDTVRSDFSRLKADPHPGWQPETKAGYQQKVEAAQQEQYRKHAEAQHEKDMQALPRDLAYISFFAERYHIPWKPLEPLERNLPLNSFMTLFSRVRRDHKDEGPMYAFDESVKLIKLTDYNENARQPEHAFPEEFFKQLRDIYEHMLAEAKSIADSWGVREGGWFAFHNFKQDVEYHDKKMAAEQH